MNRTQNKNQEVRNGAASVELRKSKSGAILEGRIPYNSRSSFLGFYETLQRGCFADSLRNGPEPFCFWSHDSLQPLGRTSTNLTISDTDSALVYAVMLPDTSTGRDVQEMASTGLLDSTSFGFSVSDSADEEWSLLPDGNAHRSIKRATLYEVSPCAVGAYPAASVKLAARSALRYAPAAILEALKRDSQIDNEDANPDDCLCECAQCVDGDCSQCSATDCDEETCSCAASRRSLHVAALLRRRAVLMMD